MQVAEEVRQQKLDLTETEFALLLQACARGSASWQTMQGLLLMMTKELTRLQPETLAAAEQYFRSAAVLLLCWLYVWLWFHFFFCCLYVCPGSSSSSVCTSGSGSFSSAAVYTSGVGSPTSQGKRHDGCRCLTTTPSIRLKIFDGVGRCCQFYQDGGVCLLAAHEACMRQLWGKGGGGGAR